MLGYLRIRITRESLTLLSSQPGSDFAAFKIEVFVRKPRRFFSRVCATLSLALSRMAEWLEKGDVSAKSFLKTDDVTTLLEVTPHSEERWLMLDLSPTISGRSGSIKWLKQEQTNSSSSKSPGGRV